MRTRAYVLLSIGAALLAFALVNTAAYTPPGGPSGPTVKIGNGIQRIEP